MGRATGTTLGFALFAAACAVAEPRKGAADAFARERSEMVRTQIEARGVRDARVLRAMRKVPRHEFVPPELREFAYEDRPLPIGLGQTISQPYIVARMTELLELEPGDRVLEIGTGSGYQAAVLAELAREVYSIEIVGELAERARRDLARQGYERVHVIHGDGYDGLPQHAPFDAIIATAAPPRVPQPLLDQLAPGARLVIPVGESSQALRVYTRTPHGIESHTANGVRFVPMTGKARQADPD